jgi:hypothetical protein
MRLGVLIPVGVFAFLLVEGSIHAQEPASPKVGADPAVRPVHVESAGPAPIAVEEGAGEAVFSMDLMLGMMSGVRAQLALCRSNCQAWVAEAFYGALLTKLGASEGAGLGARALFRRCSRDGRNSLMLGPGFGLLYQFERGDRVLMAAPTLDLSWLHALGDRGGWELGLNVGVGVGLAGHHNEESALGKVTPLISVYSGFRF